MQKPLTTAGPCPQASARTAVGRRPLASVRVVNILVRMLTALFLATAALLAITAAVSPAHGATEERNGPSVGAGAPDFTLLDTHGEMHALSGMQGQVVVLNFWAFWCDTWKAEMPDLERLAKRQNDLRFRLAALSVDGTRYAEFQRLTGDALPFPVLMDVGGRISQEYRVGHVPTVVILDAKGRVRYCHNGYPGNDVVLSVVRRIESAGEG